jgi:hypothetical protein
VLEPLLQLRVGDPSIAIEGAVGLGQGEHVRVEPRTQVLEWHL